ncbi:MAG: TlpA family protein disulfide reductase [Gallionellaceae bacterium]|nr:TlpA family protein disulfide reductase [Gallionellaceae bacterium]
MKRLVFLAGLSLAILAFAPAAAAQEIKPFSQGSFQQLVSAHKGKPFIVNFWSLSCVYCKDELGMFKKLTKKYPKLDLVLVSTDTPEEVKSISATLAKFSLNKAEAWVFADSNADRLRFEVDKRWYGELPRTYFVSAKNEMKAISGKLEQKDVEQWINGQ